MIHFDFDDRYQDEHVVGSAISRRDGVCLSVVVHGLLAAGADRRSAARRSSSPRPEELAQRQAGARARSAKPRSGGSSSSSRGSTRRRCSRRERASCRIWIAARRRRRSRASPRTRCRSRAATPPERVEAAEAEQRARGRGAAAAAAARAPKPSARVAAAGRHRVPAAARDASAAAVGRRSAKRCATCSATCRTRRSTTRRAARTIPGATIQFDTKGVEFGPWLRRFVAQVRRNWFVPQAAMAFRGHVVLQFNIHETARSPTSSSCSRRRSTRSTAPPSTRSSGRIPTAPLPPEYPSDKAFFTVTFYYNEEPPN